MTQVLFKGFGISVLQRGESFLLRYDIGDIGCCMVEHVISEAEARLAMENKDGAYQVIRAAQRRGAPSEAPECDA